MPRYNLLYILWYILLYKLVYIRKTPPTLATSGFAKKVTGNATGNVTDSATDSATGNATALTKEKQKEKQKRPPFSPPKGGKCLTCIFASDIIKLHKDKLAAGFLPGAVGGFWLIK